MSAAETYECRLCTTVHDSQETYQLHLQGSKHRHALEHAEAGAPSNGEDQGVVADTSGGRVNKSSSLPDELVASATEILSHGAPALDAFWREKYEKDARRNWDLFYKRNTTNFYKDRHYLTREFVELRDSSEPKVLIEVGCGVGNAGFPLLEENKNLFVYMLDFSARAIEFVKKHPNYDETRCQGHVCDIVNDPIPPGIVTTHGGAEFATMVFVLSAISPDKMVQALCNVHGALKTGAVVFVRDYARYDLAQLRFSENEKSKIEENFYVRQDGTRAYYFSIEDLERVFVQAGFESLGVEYCLKQIVNRKRQLTMNRVWLQGKFRKL